MRNDGIPPVTRTAGTSSILALLHWAGWLGIDESRLVMIDGSEAGRCGHSVRCSAYMCISDCRKAADLGRSNV
jgi:hypothetical protein